MPQAASRLGSSSPQAALRSVSIAPSVDQTVDLEASYIAEGQHVSGIIARYIEMCDFYPCVGF